MTDTDKTAFVNDFRLMNDELRPLINDFLKENQVHVKPFVFFIASLLKEIFKMLEQEEFENFSKFKESVIVFLLDSDDE